MAVITFQRKTVCGKSVLWSDAFSLYVDIRKNEKTMLFICDTKQVNDKMRVIYNGAAYRIVSITSKGAAATKTKELIR